MRHISTIYYVAACFSRNLDLMENYWYSYLAPLIAKFDAVWDEVNQDLSQSALV